jgi:hypothetical protein
MCKNFAVSQAWISQLQNNMLRRAFRHIATFTFHARLLKHMLLGYNTKQASQAPAYKPSFT